MQPTYISISTLFGSQTRHTVPLFQRPYVWGREEQWEPLWEDLAGLFERLSRRQGDTTVAGHFLGTVVLEQTPNATGSLPCRQVIDGQQRLTTLQIMLKAAEHALTAVAAALPEDERLPIVIARRQLSFLTENPAFSAEEENTRSGRPTRTARRSRRCSIARPKPGSPAKPAAWPTPTPISDKRLPPT